MRDLPHLSSMRQLQQVRHTSPPAGRTPTLLRPAAGIRVLVLVRTTEVAEYRYGYCTRTQLVPDGWAVARYGTAVPVTAASDIDCRYNSVPYGTVLYVSAARQRASSARCTSTSTGNGIRTYCTAYTVQWRHYYGISADYGT